MAASRAFAFVLVALLAVGCTTTSGIGLGRSRTGTGDALFTWKQDGPRSGRMTASLDSGQIYVGRFFQITSRTRVTELESLWRGWGPSSPGWDHWGPDAAFLTHYRGTVVENLNGPDGQMRCRVRLTRPAAGIAGGGGGHCQRPDGTTLGATFPPVGWPG
jgi:predicted small secreted protein